ncbi:SecY-interacting protein [Marinobacterium weihaiense]|uniref:SecY-interacting protein n=1 Tax=Marinobacterium weihaiense TaxID=2851016 RepID=A0ABS6MB81_9GAMM|nr:SecY-interacting protein [Marinobacterium weihaiense]MBV0933553.1 SecY-interacting protein [Marinobacterium weihaiense]
MTDTQDALDRLIDRTLQHYEEDAYPLIPYDPEWPSPCYRHQAEAGTDVSWQPVRNMDNSDMFERLSEALNIDIHSDIIEYYTRYWSDPLPCCLPDGRRIHLLFAWSQQDLERLRANLIGHALSKQKQKRPLTLFFATLEPNTDYMLSIDNRDGSVWLERPGKAPEQQLSTSLAELFDTLQPAN